MAPRSPATMQPSMDNETPASPALTLTERIEADAQRLYEEPLLTASERKAERKRAFVTLIADGLNFMEACEALHLDRSTAFRWRQADPEFAQACRDALKVSIEKLEAEAERRALHGSDKLLMFLLERRAPDKYHIAQKLEHSGSVDLAAAVMAARRRANGDATPSIDDLT